VGLKKLSDVDIKTPGVEFAAFGEAFFPEVVEVARVEVESFHAGVGSKLVVGHTIRHVIAAALKCPKAMLQTCEFETTKTPNKAPSLHLGPSRQENAQGKASFGTT